MNREDETAAATEQQSHKYQTSMIVGAFKAGAQAAAAIEALRGAGFKEDEIELFSGPEGERDLDLDGKYHGILQHLQRSFEHFMRADSLELDYYEQSLQRGEHVIQVRTNSKTKDTAHEILKAAGGEHLNYYGPLITEKLE